MGDIVRALRERVNGPVYARGDMGYAEENASFNTAVIHSPEVVVGADSAGDVVEAVQLARQYGIKVAVQSTGHGAHVPITHGLLVSTRRLNGVSVDAETRTAKVGAGARFDALIAAGAEDGLLPISGSSTRVGAVGFVLGGGIGPLTRSYGFGSDYLVELSVVTGKGELVEANAQEHADLFWALRGGKIGLGIVTEARLRLVELRRLYAGALFFEEGRIEQALRGWVDWTATADAKVTTSAAILRFPPIEEVPPPLRGRCLLTIRFAYPGGAEEGARLAEPLRAVAPVYVDRVGEMPATEIARIHNDPTEPSPNEIRGMLVTHVDQELATALLKHVGAGKETPFVSAELRQMGGAARRDVAGGSAAGGREAGFTLSFIAGDPTQFETVVPAEMDVLSAELQPWIAAETNINFVGAPDPKGRLGMPWTGEKLTRLNEVRKKYDPDGIW